MMLALPDRFHKTVRIDAKRKVDGEKAESRQGVTVSTHWLNERFRCVKAHTPPSLPHTHTLYLSLGFTPLVTLPPIDTPGSSTSPARA